MIGWRIYHWLAANAGADHCQRCEKTSCDRGQFHKNPLRNHLHITLIMSGANNVRHE